MLLFSMLIFSLLNERRRIMHQKEDLGPMLGCCGHLARERMDARMNRCGVTPAQAHALLYLHFHGGQAPQVELTEFLRVKPPTANGILSRMEEKELICRTVSPADARCRIVALTEKGQERQEEIHQCFLDAERMMAEGFTEEETQRLKSLLRRVIQNLEEDRNL